MIERTRMLKDQAKLLRDLAEAPGQLPEIRERMQKLARGCDELATVLERSIERSQEEGGSRR